MLISITGSIGSGKTTVSSIIREMGYHVVSSDKLANDLIAPGQEPYRYILEAFGLAVLGDGGEIDRQKLAGMVFNDKEKLRTLNRIMHPAVTEQLLRIYKAEQKSLKDNLFFVELPLLIESKFYRHSDRVILLSAPKKLKLQFMSQKGLPLDEALLRLENQKADHRYRKHADFEIRNEGNKDLIRQQVWDILNQLRMVSERPAGSA